MGNHSNKFVARSKINGPLIFLGLSFSSNLAYSYPSRIQICPDHPACEHPPLQAGNHQERENSKHQALQSFYQYLDHLNDRQSVAKVKFENAQSSFERDRAMSEALGQRNLGNTCYANSAHALLWAMNLRVPSAPDGEILAAATRRLAVHPLDQTSSLREVFQNFERYLYAQRSPVNPQGFLDQRHPLIGFQHDSPEYLYKFLELLESDQGQQNPIGAFRLAEQSILSDGRKNPIRLGADLRNRWELPLSASHEPISLQQILDQAMAPAAVDEVQWEENPQIKLAGERKTYLIQEGGLPRAALLQVKRFGADGRKIVRRINTSPQITLNYYADLGKLQDSPAELRLQLKGAIIHHGVDHDFGHYSAVIRHQGRWYLHDDLRVTETSERIAFDRMNREGYLFLYDSDPLPVPNGERASLHNSLPQIDGSEGESDEDSDRSDEPRYKSRSSFTAATSENQAQVRQQALERLNAYLDQWSERGQQAKVMVTHLPLPERDRWLTETLGQRNFGNTCYANSAHALLAAMNLRMPRNPLQSSGDNRSDLTSQLRAQMEGFSDYLYSQRTEHNPRGYLDQAHPLIGFQHDSSEYLYKLLELLETSPNQENPSGAFRVGYQSVLADGRRNPVSLTDDQRNRFELPLVRSDEPIGLQNILDQALAPSDAENIQWESDPQVRMNGQRHTYLIKNGQLPRTILLQLKRFEGNGRKITRRVSPSPEIQIPYFHDAAQIQDIPALHTLRLKGAILHHGASQNHGHYTTLLRFGNQWIHHDDSQVTSIEEAAALDLIERDGYVFLYSNENEPVAAAADDSGPQPMDIEDPAEFPQHRTRPYYARKAKQKPKVTDSHKRRYKSGPKT